MHVHTLAAFAERFDLAVAGEGSTPIAGVCALTPGEPGRLAYLADPRGAAALAASQAAAVVVHPRQAASLRTPGLVAANPMLAFARIAQLFDTSRRITPGVHGSAVIDESAVLGEGCEIGPFVAIGPGARVGAGSRIGAGSVLAAGVVVGEGARIAARVSLGERVRIGARVNIQPGAVIGSRGFGNARTAEGRWEELPQFGGVLIGDDVEVGANTTIDCGTFGDTVIGNGVKLDNQIQIAHNCVIGEHTAIAGCVGIAGSTRIGARCMIGGAATINGHIEICDDVLIYGMTMVTGRITEPGEYGSGLPFDKAADWRKTVARVRRLERLEARVKTLEKQAAAASGANPEATDSESDA
jgi:UDP-3-O-[3-hydroxymyristoyl] glucosamine N-acyltransferase